MAEPTATTMTEKSRASLPIRDYLIITITIVGWIVYADRRFSSLENGKDALQKDLASLRSDRATELTTSNSTV